MVIEAHGIRRADDKFAFYYDETNNIRKFLLTDDGTNASEHKNFVLGGIALQEGKILPEIASLRGALWSLYKTLSPVPLLDSWRDVVMRATHAECVSFLEDSDHPPIGKVTAAKVLLTESFSDDVSRMVQAGMIGLNGEEAVYLEQARSANAMAA